MKPKSFVVAMTLVLPAIAQADPPSPVPASSTGAVTITRRGTAPWLWAPDEFFTGCVRIAPLFQATPPAQASGASVTFDPGARTIWHTHPLGQTLIVTAGHGWVQQWGGPVTEVESGDVVFEGHFIVRGGKVVGLEGTPPGSRTVIIEFPSLEQA